MVNAAGIDQISDRFGAGATAQAAVDLGGLGAEADLSAGIGSLARVTGALSAQLAAWRADQAMVQRGIDYIDDITWGGPVTPNGVFVFNMPADLGPKTGYVWAVQRVTITNPNAAAGDFAEVFKATAVNDVSAQQNQLYSFFGATPLPWHTGRTGLILKPYRRLAISYGASAGTGATSVLCSIDVIQLEERLLARFLL
jgi:hypothetical protein